MYKAYNYLNIFSAPLFCLFCIGRGPYWVAAAYALAFVVHPAFDFLIARYFKDFMLKVHGGHGSRLGYQVPLLLAVPFQLFLVSMAIFNGSESLVQALCSGALCGLSGGILGIGAAHELIHRKKKLERSYGRLMLYAINYPHFYLEHLWHHVAIGTAKDPDTAKKGESLYRFLLRSVTQGWIECWKWESRRPLKKNRMIKLTTGQAAIHAILYFALGPLAAVVYLAQGVATLFLLKWINYVEHYGLKRERVNGKLEPVGHKHSWDSTQALTNFSLFNLGFHSQHHAQANIEYHDLPLKKDEWNELPAGYSTMMVLALSPKRYKALMDEKIKELENVAYA